MTRSRNDTIDVAGRRVWRALVCFLLLAGVFLGASTALELFALKQRLGDAAAERAAMRFTTDTKGEPRAFDDFANACPETRDVGDVWRSRDAALVTAARRWLDAPPRGADVDRRGVVLKGLGRWNVERRYVEPFVDSREDSALFWSTPRAELAESRRSTSDASRGAIEALADLGPDGDAQGLDDALAFLNELDDEASAPEDAFLWTATPDAGDPVDSASFFVAADFAPAYEAVLAAKLCDASARLFLLLTLGLTPALCVLRTRDAARRLLAALRARMVRTGLLGSERAAPRSSDAVVRFCVLSLLASVRLLN